MKLNTPLVTLLTGAALGVGVLVASVLWPASTSSAGTSSAGGYGATSPAAPASSATVVIPLSPTSSSSAIAPAPATAPATAPAAATAAAGTAPAPAPITAAATATAPGAATATAAATANVPPQADYVGRVDGAGAAVAVSVHGDKAVAYVCNGHAVAAWLRGTAVNGKLELTGKNGARLSVDYRKAKAAGYIMADGTRYTFSAPMVHRVSSVRRPPGLYEATAMVQGVSIKAGWIVLPDGSQVGSVEYFTNSAVPPTAQAPVLDLATGTASYDGVTLVASLISGITGSGF
jgi:hypothetical protein